MVAAAFFISTKLGLAMTQVESQITVPNNLAVLKIQSAKVLGSGIKIRVFREIF
jgi:hypothetical protein